MSVSTCILRFINRLNSNVARTLVFQSLAVTTVSMQPYIVIVHTIQSAPRPGVIDLYIFQGSHGQGKVREKCKKFKVREKSGNFEIREI